jgi:hypothetical protein
MSGNVILGITEVQCVSQNWLHQCEMYWDVGTIWVPGEYELCHMMGSHHPT